MLMLLTLDDPLVSPQKRREDIVRRMAADLVAESIDLSNKREIVSFLLRKGYSSFDATRLWEDAAQAAFQPIVAREMGAS